MARAQENKTIDDTKYICKMMPATLANKVLIEMLTIVSQPVLASLATMMADGPTQVDVIVDTAIKYLVQNVSPDDGDRICKSMLQGVRAEGVGSLDDVKVFDEHFRGDILHLWKVVIWSIQVNYRGFFYAANSNPAVSNLAKTVSNFAATLTATLTSGGASSSEKASTSET